MARYIDAYSLLENLKKQYGEQLGWQGTVNMSDVGMMIEDAPTADVVEVVRCKDCKFNVANMEKDPLDITDYSGDDIVCSYFMTDGLEPTDFCSYGAKMKGGE